MNYIYEASDLFNFQNLSLNTPTLINGGAGGFFSKYINEVAGEKCPLYIKTPLCNVKGGFSISPKKIYGDLVFSREDNEELNRWIENLISHTQKKLYEHRDEWFQGGITEADIEEAMINPIKSYKSGKCYLVRCGVKIENGEPHILVYDSQQKKISLEEVGEQHIITLLEFKGVRCTMKTFQLEIEVKQVMITKKFNILEQNFLAGSGAGEHEPEYVSPPANNDVYENSKAPPAPAAPPLQENARDETVAPAAKSDSEEESDSDTESDSGSDLDKPPIVISNTDDTIDILDEPIEKYLENSPELAPVNLDEFSIDETPIKIKKENELYYKMYQEAKKKARDARKIAIDAYLEAKNIKSLYEIEDAEESDEENNLDEIMADIENL
jgi:hypothetical protein